MLTKENNLPKNKFEGSEDFKRGVEQFRKREIPRPEGKKVIFVKRKVTNTEWNNLYSQSPGYCFLDKAERGVLMGFIVTDKIPLGCEKLTPAEMLQMEECYKQQDLHI